MLKRVNVLFVLLLCVPFLLPAQKRKSIKFSFEVMDIPVTTLYVESVIYNNADKNIVGTIENNGKTDTIYMADGVSAAFYNYLKFNLPANKTGPAVVLKITEVNVTEKIGGTSDSMRVKLRVEFYKTDSSGFSKIYETEYVNTITNRNGIKGYANFLQAALGKCMSNYINTINPAAANKQDINKAFKTSKPISHPREFLFTCTNLQGQNANGIDVSFYRFPDADSSSDWQFPFCIFIENMNIAPTLFNKSGFRADKLSYGMAGVSAFKKIKGYFFLNVGALMIIGSEMITDDMGFTSTDLVVGAQAMQGIYFISKAQYGFVLGIGAYERFLDSQVYKNDIGFKIEAGIKF